MDILLISYGDIDYDGRLRSLIDVFSEMGTVHSFSRGTSPLNETSIVNNTSYLRFIRDAIKYAKSLPKIDWLVLDNRKATIPGLIIRKKYRPNYTIQDCRELYLIKEVKHLTGKLGCIFEKKMIKKADIIICANQERGKIMKEEFSLEKEPLTYENLRKLQYESMEKLELAKMRIDPYIIEGEFRIISSSGCSILRTNDVLVKNLTKVERPCRLFLVGDYEETEKTTIKSIMEEQNILNVEILGRLSQTELKYLISNCHIGIVNYGQYDTNNRLCASGKLYEFLYEGIPVVTTTNPPLKRICDEYSIGVSDDQYFIGINCIINRYDYYKENVCNYIEEHTVKENDLKLINQLQNKVSRGIS